MKFSVRHSLPGRVRLHVPLLYFESPLAAKVVSWLERQDGILKAHINHGCASLVIEYDRKRPEILSRFLFFLEYLTIDGLRELLAKAETEPGASLTAKPNIEASAGTSWTSKRFPLALPTVSLALSVSANPLVLAVNIPLLLWNALPIVKRAWRVIRHERRLNVDFLDVLAVSASLAQNNILTGAIIVWLVRLGDWIRDMTAARSRRAVSELLEFQTKMTWIVVDGQVVSIPTSQVAVDNVVMVHPGEMVPVDGEVLSGLATIEQKVITGESLPVSRGPGELVFAGTSVREGQITVRAMRVGSDTAAAKIVELVESAPVGETRMQNHAEIFADRLVLPTIALATGTAAVTADFNRFLSLVIVDYGTGIRVAAPTSVLSSMTHAARMGIIIKGGSHMEKLAHVDTIVFDKTGTLTHGVPAVSDPLSYNERHFSSRSLIALAAAAETRLQHPVAEAIRVRSKELELEVPECKESNYRIGLGVEARINGYFLHVGSERFLRQNDIHVDHASGDQESLNERGYSSLYVAIDGKLTGLIPYADQIRPESKEVIQTLHKLGIRNTIMLTGDNAVVARAVCARLGLARQYAETMPADKAQIVQDLKKEGRVVAMVGDGINDSPALSFADVGVAMKHGAEVVHESAHVVLMEDSLWKLVMAIEISRGAVSLIKQNYAIVAIMNTVALGLALPGGLILPEITALLSNGSAVLASLNGLRPIMRYQ
jgi:heavy metal translocating P-type ATPase